MSVPCYFQCREENERGACRSLRRWHTLCMENVLDEVYSAPFLYTLHRNVYRMLQQNQNNVAFCIHFYAIIKNDHDSNPQPPFSLSALTWIQASKDENGESGELKRKYYHLKWEGTHRATKEPKQHHTTRRRKCMRLIGG
jgi:hypothetical protein